MMTFHWKKQFEVGRQEIDLQHHYFVELINRIETTLSTTDDPDRRQRLMMELYKYAEFHFLSEENIALSLNLPNVVQHHELHKELLEQIEHHIADVMAGLMSADAMINFLMEWFAGHTIHEDKRLFSQSSMTHAHPPT
ncbi:MAG: hemerythrin family protein [Magnetococcales bacterium]|nr:hemerythrin family protein [Magnetococcales bacterium]